MNKVDNQAHFDRISQRYVEAAKTWAALYRQLAELINPQIHQREILDIGNGGLFAYDTDLPQQVTVLDISPAMLDQIDNPKIAKVIGDARTLEGIEDQSMDVILFIHCLHHINGNSFKKTVQILEQIIGTAKRKLKQGGTLIIAEPVCRRWLFPLEKLLYKGCYYTLKLLGVPMIFFYSLETLTETIRLSFSASAEDIELIPLSLDNSFDPLGGSFPGLIKIPYSLRPTNFYYIKIQKKLVCSSDE